MKNKLEINQTLGQHIRLLPVQLQLGKFLELNNQELDDLIKITVDENPALKYTDDNVTENINSSDSYNDIKDSSEIPVTDELYPRHQYHDFSNSSLLSSHPDESNGQVSLYDYLLSQLDESGVQGEIYDIVRYMIGCIDGNGYMTRTISGVSDDLMLQKGIVYSYEDLQNAWQIMRNFEPAGIGAVDLKDCLLMQLNDYTEQTPFLSEAKIIVGDFFDDFINRRTNRLLTETGLTRFEIDGAIELIRSLDPRPGRRFTSSNEDSANFHLTPDFAILPDMENDGRLNISSLTELPDLSIDDSFSTALSDARQNKATKTKIDRNETLFIKQKCEDAGNFIDLVKLRQQTLYTIIKCIAGMQKQFFISGDAMDLKPMVLKDVADSTGLDLSVISRATSSRYILTVAGIISLKSLFNEKKTTLTGEGATAIQIVSVMENLIKEEDKYAPLTDDQLVDELKKRGFDIARRTVAKYREKAGIENARLRKITK